MWDPGQKRGWHYTHLKKCREKPVNAGPGKQDEEIYESLEQYDPIAKWNSSNFWGRFKMRMKHRNAVIKTHEGIQIVSIPEHAKHNMEIGSAPPGWQPGDEKFMAHKNGKVHFDHEAHRKHHMTKDSSTRDEHNWNSRTPFERFKSKLKGG